MTREELNRVLDLQRKAYNLLLWLDEQARHQNDMLSDENVAAWKHGDSCEEWVRRMIGIFPRDLRPEASDIPAFSHLMSSFFNTSFRVDYRTESRWDGDWDGWTPVSAGKRLVAGTSSTRKTKGQKEKQAESAHNLQLIALAELAIESDCDLSPEQLKTVAHQPENRDALNLYSYAHELVRRSQFASQGAAVHALWNTMDKKTRQSLNVEVIWQARENLRQAIENVA
ncbi:MAG TPA: hypothetical protein VM821_07670 [Abditibacteriaceae bacterium]|nr:hypothetical protein [Abditibacteriaceae bacterium]